MIAKILGSSAFWVVNKTIAKSTSMEAALMLADLTDKEQYFTARGEITECGYFFNTSENIKEDTGLTYHSQKKALKQLTDIGFIETKLKGVPAKLHFKISENKILNFLKTGSKESLKQDLKKVKTNNNKSNNNKSTTTNVVVHQTSKEQEANDLFGKAPNPKKKTLFKNSLVFDFEIFEKKLTEAKNLGVDINYYYNAIKDWNDIKKVTRDADGWIATARTFMRGDKNKARLQIIKTEQEQAVLDKEMQEYLGM